MLKNKRLYIFFIILSCLLSLLFYPSLPQTITTHWGLQGQPDGYSSKLIGLVLFPLLLSFFFLLFSYLFSLEQFKKSSKSFTPNLINFISTLFLFIIYLQCIVIIWNLGYTFNLIQLLIPALSILFFECGRLLHHTKQNMFVGVRTPWTLQNTLVWEKTHQLAGRLFKIAACCLLGGVIFPEHNVFFIIIPIFLASFIPILYSFFISQKK